jgi:hypothetical protein
MAGIIARAGGGVDAAIPLDSSGAATIANSERGWLRTNAMILPEMTVKRSLTSAATSTSHGKFSQQLQGFLFN